MTRRIIITPKASEDIDELFAYIAQDNYDAALKFFDAIRLTFSQLAKTPGIGSSCKSINSRLVDMRRWAVKGFERYLIFYLYTDEYVEVVRVIHAARNISAIFEEE
ncbi:type II toxin-antitoxin system RelE/ParE family toxin [Scytonema sp. NUACC21]